MKISESSVAVGDSHPEGVTNPALQAVIGLLEILHLRRIAGENHQGVAGFHITHELINGLFAKVLGAPIREAVCLVHEEDSTLS